MKKKIMHQEMIDKIFLLAFIKNLFKFIYKITQKGYNMILVIIISLIHITQHINCPSIISIDSMNSPSLCTYRYIINTSNNSQQCTFSQCQHSTNNGQNTVFSWLQCYSQCCSSFLHQMPILSNQISLLQKCQAQSNYKKKLIFGLIIGLICGGVILILGLIICLKNKDCYLRKKLRRCFPIKKDESITTEQGSQITNILIDSLNQVYLNKQKFIVNSNIFRSKCFICNKPRPDCQILCKHHFHSKCLQNNTMNCHICNSQISQIKIYCVDCKKLIVKIDAKIKSVQKKYNKIKQFKRCMICNTNKK